MSFALTTEQIRNRTKTVTRRRGWKNLEPGTLIQPVVKGMGLKKGEKVEKIGGPIRVVSVRREPLNRMSVELIGDEAFREVEREGFGDRMGPYQFRVFFAESNHCSMDEVVTRIEFEYCDDEAQDAARSTE